jgi:RsiW-degrading membrane proteinase PrsW (M82 family)
MSTVTPAPRQPPDPASSYSVLCLVALLGILLVLFQRSASPSILIPVLIGTSGVVFRWRAAPLLILLALLVEYMDLWPFMHRAWAPRPSSSVADLLLAGAVLLYCAAQYRWQSLLVTILPPDPRQRRSSSRGLINKAPSHPEGYFHPGMNVPRSAALVSNREVTFLLLSMPVWVGLALYGWDWLPSNWTALGLSPRVWRTVALAWLVGVSFLVVAGLLGYFGRARMHRGEALQFLQDTLWRETRREQSRINRWLVWARWRRPERKELR